MRFLCSLDDTTKVVVVLADLVEIPCHSKGWNSTRLEKGREMRRTRRRVNKTGWGFLSPSTLLLVFVYLFAVLVNKTNGLFHVDVQTVNRPVPGQPVNLEIVVEPPFSMLAPNFGPTATAGNGTEQLSLASGSGSSSPSVDSRNSKIDPLNSSSSDIEDDERNLTSGHNRRRGIFNFQQPGQSLLTQASSPDKINIQIQGKLPFNPFNLFNMDTIKSLVQSVTENLTGSKKAYSTGFDDSVTIISDDPEKPVARAINSPFVNSNLNSNNNNNNEQNSFQNTNSVSLPFVRLPSLQPPPLQGHQGQQQQFQLQKPHTLSNSNNKNYNPSPPPPNNNHNNGHIDNKLHQNNHHSYKTQIPPPPPQQHGLLTEESMINKQMETLNEVLTHEMNHKDHRSSTTIAPLTFPFLPDLSALSQLFNWGEQGARTLAVCNACRVGFGLFVSRARQGGNLANLMELATFGCTFFRITSPEMCKGLVYRFGPILHYMVTQKESITAERFCGISLQSSGCTTTDPDSYWIDLSQYSVVPVSIDPPTPRDNAAGGTEMMMMKDEQPSPRRRNFQNFNTKIPKGIRALKVLHLTDIHVDIDYLPGSMNDCENEMCCHAEDGKGPQGKRAGFYGDYSKCDLPFHAYMDALGHISATHPDIDIIYLTGDFVPHNIWNTSIAKNLNIFVNASQYIQDYFPRAKVIPVIGNHETHPVNMFSPFGVPGEFSTDWLYTAAARAWAKWLPKESIHNFLHAGFYDVEINKYFRVIVLNTNLCYGYNFWQSFEPRDPSGQLRWLARELQRSEDIGQIVHILGHVASSEADCFTVWSQNFYEIINRYSSIVKAQFYGHTHFDEFRLYYHNYNRSQAISPVYIGSSLTPYTNLNPGYKIFTVDGARGADSTWDIIDHETWIYNLTEANINPHLPPRWYKLYKATEAFEIPDLSPSSLNDFVQRMSSNVTAFNTYYRIYHKATDVALADGCDNLYRKRVLCSIVTPHFGEQKMCVQLQSNVDGIILPASIFSVGGDSPLRASFGTRSSTDSPIQRVLSFGRSLLRALG